MQGFQPCGVISLLTDFGYADDYVGQMHGVIYSIDKGLKIVDLCHEVPPGDVRGAAFLLKHDRAALPVGTVHVVIVDPGVGSDRKVLAAEISGCVYIAPDNGLIDPLIKSEAVRNIRSVENRDYFAKEVSSTFHGRDIMARVGAYLAKGIGLQKVGPPIDHWQTLVSIDARLEDDNLVGEVLWVDRFGNLVTNLRDIDMEARSIVIKGQKLESVGNFAEGTADRPAWLIGSKGTVEIVVNRGNAASMLEAGTGETVEAPLDRS